MQTSSVPNKKGRLLTGIRVSGTPHLGNYLGAIRPAIERSKDFETFLFVADYHGLTTSPPAEELQNNIRQISAAWLAAGVDPHQVTLWRQSSVPEVLELAYYFTCVTSMGLMERAHSFKDAKAKDKVVKMGLFYYPLLMAADILLYQADYVPVGKDQAQHLEMTRDIATFFNETYEPVFNLPKQVISEETGAVPGVDGRKMSKSYGNGIDLFSPEKILKKQIMGIKTDSKTLEEPKIPEECLVYEIFKLFGDEAAVKDMAEKLKKGGYGYGDAKKTLFSYILDHFGAMRKEFGHWVNEKSELDAILHQGGLKAREKAQPLIERLRNIVGL